ncbi:MAG TPA: S24/S26 family peptidase [Gemmatimonadales bacterium]
MSVSIPHLPVTQHPIAEREARLRQLLPLLKRAGSEFESVLNGSSMIPAIPDGAVIRIRCASLVDCRVGDIVVTQDAGQLVAHRIVYRGRRAAASRHILTRGDALWLPDPPLPVDALLGRVTEVHRNGAWAPPEGARPVPGPARLWLSVISWVLESSVPLAVGLALVAGALRRLTLRMRRAVARLRAGSRPRGAA